MGISSAITAALRLSEKLPFPLKRLADLAYNYWWSWSGDRIGQYYWFDFDLVSLDRTLIKLRMVVNTGDADCIDGFWGAVWTCLIQESLLGTS